MYIQIRMLVKKISVEVKVGILFIIAVVLFIWGFNFIKGTDLFGGRRLFYAVYDKVEGLEPANKVKVNGLNIGQVSHLGFIPGTSLICAELYIKSDLPIPKNSIARIYSTDLLGGKAIEIILGDSDKLAVSGDTLQSELEISIREQVSEQVEPVQKKAMALINSLDSLLMSIQGVFNPESQDNIISIFENIRVAIFSIKNSATLVDTLLAKEKSNLEKIISDIENITANLRDNNDEISTIFRNFAILSDSLASADIPQTFREAQEVIENLKIISDKLNRGEGTMGQLITNDTLYLNLQQSTENLNKLIEDIRLNPKKYVKFSVF